MESAESPTATPAVRIEDLTFSYGEARFRLAIPDLSLDKSSQVAVIGPSGSGKSTLFDLLMGLQPNFGGTIRILGEDLYGRRESARSSWRLENIGFIPQNFALLDYLTVREQVLMPGKFLRGRDLTKTEQKADSLLERSGLVEMASSYQDSLSQGERQRVAICRGLAHAPRLILADEPTGNLDPETQRNITSMLIDESRRLAATLLMITHDHSLLSEFDQVIDVSKWSGKGDA